MKFTEISCYATINKVDEDKVNELVESIKANGWTGAPILVDAAQGMLVTGCHRFAALEKLNDEFELNDDTDVAEDVSDIINEYCGANDCTIDEIDFSDLRNVFAGTWVEEYKDDIAEW